MKITTARRALIAAIAVAAFALSSCTEGPAGIFASIASETPTNENMTKAIKDSSQSFVVRLGSTYYAGIGTLWKKADGATQWTPADTSGVSSSTVFAGSAAVIGTDMYVAFFDSDTGDGLGVWSTTNGTVWAPVDPAFPAAGRDLSSILAANGNLFAVTANTRTLTTDIANYSFHHLNVATFEDTNIIASTSVGVPTSVAFGGGTFWLTAGDVILSGTATNLSPTTEPPTGAAYSGVCAYGTDVIISNRNGYLYYYNGGTWITAGPFADSNGDAYSLSTPTYVDDGTNQVLVVGTNSIPGSSSTPPVDGYLEFAMPFTAGMEPTVDHGIISNANNFDTSLTGRSVSAMPLFDLGGGDFRLFALTNGYGLWSNTYNGAEWELWVRE